MPRLGRRDGAVRRFDGAWLAFVKGEPVLDHEARLERTFDNAQAASDAAELERLNRALRKIERRLDKAARKTRELRKH